MDYKDYYATLDVGKKATPDEIQKSYRKLARKFHPDINKTPEAEARFKEINEAYEVLKDPNKRAKYDRFGSAWKQAQRTGAPPPGFEDIFSQFGFGGGPGFAPGATHVEFDLGGGGFSSFFETLFGQAAGGGRARPSAHARRRGPAHEARITLSLEEAFQGGRHELTLTDPETGERRQLKVNLPAGIRPGKTVRLAAQGGRGPGGERGDLFLKVDLLPHPQLELRGDDLHTRLAVAPWEAALGGRAKLRTLDGEVTLKIPPRSSSGKRIRLRGKGFPARNGKHGDLFAEIRIVVPEEVSARERELWEKLAEVSEFNPRPG